MTASIIDGKSIAAGIRAEVAQGVERLIASHDVRPGLAVALVGEDAASQVYVRSKARQTSEAGMASFKFELEEGCSQKRLLALIEELNEDHRAHGILVQLPLPPHIDTGAVINAILPQKDVDGFTVRNAGLLTTGQSALVPCTPLGCLLLLRRTIGSLSGLHAVVVGRSNIVGKPMASLLLRENATVTVAHSKTRDLQSVCASADILIAAAGRPEFIPGSWIRNGAVVIDVGINRIPAAERGVGRTRLVGDVDFASAAQRAAAITPVPGGVGPMTIACLLANTLTACRRSLGIES